MENRVFSVKGEFHILVIVLKSFIRIAGKKRVAESKYERRVR